MADFPDFGISFSPLQPPASGGPNGGANGARGGPPGSPVQEAIRILSLRIPRVVGASALAPMGLLNALGGSALGSGASANPFAPGTAAWLDFERRRGGQAGRIQGGDNGNPIVRPALPNPAIHYGSGGSGGSGGGDQGGGAANPFDRWGGHPPTQPSETSFPFPTMGGGPDRRV
jgi:hypothetical protein